MNARLQGSEIMHSMPYYEPSVRHYHPRSRFAETIVAWHEKRQPTREIHKLYREMRHEHPEEIALTVLEEFSIILRDWWALVSRARH